MFTERALVKVDAALYGSDSEDISDLQIFYKLCTDATDTCFFTAEEAADFHFFEAPQLEVVTTRSSDQDGGAASETIFAYEGELVHDPSDCTGFNVCRYVFAVHNPSDVEVPRQVSLSVNIQTQNIQDIVWAESYVNKVNKGSYVHYRILDSEFDLEYVH